MIKNNTINIFFSWQSDKNNNLVKKIVNDCIKKIKSENNYDIKYTYYPNEDNSGSPDILSTIKKKIKNCDVFIADLTTVATTKNEKHLQNSNVCYELGYADSCLPEDNIIILTDDKPENLLFDIRQRRISCYKKENEKIMSSNNKPFVNDLIVYVCSAIENVICRRRKEYILNYYNNRCQICFTKLCIDNVHDNYNIVICSNCIRNYINLCDKYDVYNCIDNENDDVIHDIIKNNIYSDLNELYNIDLNELYNIEINRDYSYENNNISIHENLKIITDNIDKITNNIEIDKTSLSNIYNYIENNSNLHPNKHNISYIINLIKLFGNEHRLNRYKQFNILEVCRRLYDMQIDMNIIITNNLLLQFLISLLIDVAHERLANVFKYQDVYDIDEPKYTTRLLKSLAFLYSFSNVKNRDNIKYNLSLLEHYFINNIIIIRLKDKRTLNNKIYNFFGHYVNKIININIYDNFKYAHCKTSFWFRFLNKLTNKYTTQISINYDDMYNQIVDLGECIAKREDTYKIEQKYMKSTIWLCFGRLRSTKF